MKNTYLVMLTIGTLTVVAASRKEVIHAPLDIISLDDITPEERKELAALEEKLSRTKRAGSGSGDILGHLKNAISQSLKKKIGQVAKASASASGSFSRSSSSGKTGSSYGYHDHPPIEYDHPHDTTDTYEHKSFDWWSLKKSILNTLLQAVKAIKGGVIAVKGQLIKGGGKLISAKGKLLSAKGDAITNLGKNLATSAVLVPHHGHSSSGHSGHDDGSSSGYHYSAPSAPEAVYHSAPSGPGSEHHPGEYYPSHHDGAPHHDGLLILKKLHTGLDATESKVPAFKPIDHGGPSLGTIVGKFFGASSSLNPHKPELFGYTSPGESYYESSKSNHEAAPSKDYVSPVATDLVKPDHIEHHGGSSGSHSDSPFEETPHYVNQNFEDYATSDTKHSPQTVKVPKTSLNAIKTQLMKEVKNKTQPESLSLNINPGQPFTQSFTQQQSFVGNQNPEYQFINQVQTLNSDQSSLPTAAALNGYSLIGQNQQFDSKPIDPISLSQYKQMSSQNLFPDLGNPNYQIPNFGAGIDLTFDGPTIGSPTFGGPTTGGLNLGNPTLSCPTLGGPTLGGPSDSVGAGSSFAEQTFDGTYAGRPTLGGPTVSSQNNGDFSNFNQYSYKPISSPSLHLQTPKKNHFLSGSNIKTAAAHPPSVDSYLSHYRKSVPKTRKHTPSKRYPSSGSSHKPKGHNFDVVESITYELGPGGPKRLT